MAKKTNKNEVLIQKEMKSLPTLGGLKEKSLIAVKEFPFVEIIDNETAKIARKNRTGLLKVRTSLQSERTIANKVLSNIKGYLKSEIDDIINVTVPFEDKQQENIDKWDEEKEKLKVEKEAVEEKRIEDIKGQIEKTELMATETLVAMENETIESILLDIKEVIAKGRLIESEDPEIMDEDFDFEEFEILYDNMAERMIASYNLAKVKIEADEVLRLENVSKEQKAKSDSIYRKCSEHLLSNKSADYIKNSIDDLLDTTFDFGENLPEFKSVTKLINSQLKNKMEQLKKDEISKAKEDRLNMLEKLSPHRESIIEGIENLTLDNSERNIKTIEILIDCPSFDTSPIVPEYEAMKLLMIKKLDGKKSGLKKEQKTLEEKAKVLQEKIDKRTKERRAELRVVGLVPNEEAENDFIGFNQTIGEGRIENATPEVWDEVVKVLKEDIIDFKKRDIQGKNRQKKLVKSKANLCLKVQKILASYEVNTDEKLKEVLDFDIEIFQSLTQWANQTEDDIMMF